MTSTLKMVEHCYKKIQKSYINEKIKDKNKRFHTIEEILSKLSFFSKQFLGSVEFQPKLHIRNLSKSTQFLKRMELEDFLFNFMTYYKRYSNQNSVVSA